MLKGWLGFISHSTHAGSIVTSAATRLCLWEGSEQGERCEPCLSFWLAAHPEGHTWGNFTWGLLGCRQREKTRGRRGKGETRERFALMFFSHPLVFHSVLHPPAEVCTEWQGSLRDVNLTGTLPVFTDISFPSSSPSQSLLWGAVWEGRALLIPLNFVFHQNRPLGSEPALSSALLSVPAGSREPWMHFGHG